MELYVGQLKSKDTIEDLKLLFKGYDKKASFEIIKLKRESGSLYYGLVNIDSERLARKALKKLNAAMLNGHPVAVREFEYRSGGNERRSLNWRELPWDTTERRLSERRKKSSREPGETPENEPKYSGYDNFSTKHFSSR